MTYRYIYIIICTHKDWKGKFYIGQRHYRGKDPYKDTYTGSGILIRRYLSKYPNEYIKIILGFYKTDEELNKAEYDFIHPCLHTENCLNLIEGGSMTTEEGKLKQAEASHKRVWTKESCLKLSLHRRNIPVKEERRKRISNSLKGNTCALGHHKSKECRIKMSEDRTHAKLMTDGISKPIYVKPEYWGEFIDIGYHFGKK